MGNTVNLNALHGGAASIESLLRGNAESPVLPRLERTILLSYASGMNRAALLAYPERMLEREVVDRYDALCGRRAAGEPVAYLVMQREFYGVPLTVTESVLIPRPETELLVDAALARLAVDRKVRVLDLGTGSGAVAIAIATQRPDAAVVAVDVSPAALHVARQNAMANAAKGVRCIASNWYAELVEERFDLIASNPPYIAEGDPHLLEGDLRFEPQLALRSGPDGLDAIRQIVAGAPARLLPGGWLLLEHGFDQGERCRTLLAGAGFVDVETLPDLNGLERVTAGRRSA
jgi:release factor glutamine methyltransferase